MPASPGQGTRNSSQGGVGILVKTHLGARLRAQFSREGCGYVAVTIRTQGADLTLVSLYLQCSTGCAGPVNAAILSSLRDLRHGIRGPLLVGGDWNVSLPELLETSIMESLLLRPMGTNLPTCGDHELDYAGLSPCLEGLTTITSSWDVPFKPHAALRIQLQVGAFQMTTPQLPVLPRSFDKLLLSIARLRSASPVCQTVKYYRIPSVISWLQFLTPLNLVFWKPQ